MLKRLLEYSFLYWNDCLRLLWPFYLFFMVVRPRVLWTYVQRVYARTSWGGKDVRPEGAWTYVHRTFERAWMGMNKTYMKSIDSEQFLNGNEWDRGTRKEWHCVVPCRDVAAADHRCGTGGRYSGLLYLQRCAGGWCRASWHDKLLCPIGYGFSLAWYYTIRDTDMSVCHEVHIYI